MNISRIRFVSGNFYQLQGLRLVPVGLLLLFLGADSWGWFNWLPGKPAGPTGFGNAWSLLAWSAALLAAVAAVNYYRQRYGAVLQFDRANRDRLLIAAVIASIQCVAIDVTEELPFLLAPLVISASLMATVVRDGWLRIHYLIGAIAWLLVSLVSMSDAGSSPFTLGHYFAVGGLTLIVCGVGDHYLLLRTFPRPTIAEGQVDA